jgi:hypothetical protein
MSMKNRFTESVDSASAPEVQLSVPFYPAAARDFSAKQIRAEAGEYCRATALPFAAQRILRHEFLSLLNYQNSAGWISFLAEAP